MATTAFGTGWPAERTRTVTLSPSLAFARSVTGTSSSSSPRTAPAPGLFASTHFAYWREAQVRTTFSTLLLGRFTSPSGVSDQ